MKVLQINSVCGIGSTGRIATDIHRQLLKDGHESYIAYGRDTPKNISAEYTIKIGSIFSRFLHLVKTRLFDRHGFGSFFATKQLIKKIEALNPDIIHLHNLHGYYVHIGVLFKYLKKSNKKIVWTLHDCWSFTGHCAYFDFPKCEGWVNGMHICSSKRTYPSSLFLNRENKNRKDKKRIFSGLDDLVIITPSNWLENLSKTSFLNQYRIQTINNGIDTSIFKPTDSNFKTRYHIHDKKVYLGVSNIWSSAKGFDIFIEMSELLNDDEVIVLVGVSQAQLSKLPKNIIGILRTTNVEELVEIYSAADVFVNPTFEDNYPTVNLEAIACGTTVVTFNSGGSPESANKGLSYVVYDTTAINLLETARNAILKNEKKYINDDISIENFVKKVLVVYKN